MIKADPMITPHTALWACGLFMLAGCASVAPAELTAERSKAPGEAEAPRAVDGPAVPPVVVPLALRTASPAASSKAAAGWTDFSSTPHDEIIYVSSSTGDDAYSGLTEQLPKATIEAAYALVDDGDPDWILLKRGDKLSVPKGLNWTKNGPPSPRDGWARLGAYGTGARPVVDCVEAVQCAAFGPGFEGTTPFTSFAITDIHFTESRRLTNGERTRVAAIAIQLIAVNYGGGGTPLRDVLLEGCKFTGFQHGLISASDTDRLSLRRNIFTEFFRDAGGGHGNGVLNSGENTLLEENVFYRLHDPVMEQVATWFTFSHSGYLGAEGSSIARGNIVIRTPEGLMQRNAVEFAQNFVALNHFTAVNTGVSFGVLPHVGGLAPKVTDNLALDNDADWLFGNMAGPSTVARNLMFRDAKADPEDSVAYKDSFVLWGNADGEGGKNVGVHNTTFEDNWLSGRIDHAHGARDKKPHYSGNTFTRNIESVGAIKANFADYLRAAGIPGKDFDDYGRFLIAWEEHADYTKNHTACAAINFYRAAQTTLKPLTCE